MPFSQKLVVAVLTNILTVAVAFLVTKLGFHESALVATQVATGIGIVASAVGGWLVKEIPAVYLQPATSVAKDVSEDVEAHVTGTTPPVGFAGKTATPAKGDGSAAAIAVAEIHADAAIKVARINAGGAVE
jgi:hypothetical protein